MILGLGCLGLLIITTLIGALVAFILLRGTESTIPDREVQSLQAGECLHTPNRDRMNPTVTVVDCGEEHFAQVYHVAPIDMSRQTDDDSIDSAAEQLCESALASSLKPEAQQGDYEWRYYRPTQEQYESTGAANAVCYVYRGDMSSSTDDVVN